MSIDTLLLILAFVLFLIAAFGVNLGRVSAGWLGAAIVTLTLLV
jgi:hypothetical protein